MRTTLAILLICILTLGFQRKLTGQNSTYVDKSKIEKQIDSIFLNMVIAAENVDYNKISLGVDDRNSAGFIINNSYFSNYDSMINILKGNLQPGTKQTITIKNKKITVLSKTIALLTASGNAIVYLNNGQSFNANFFWSLVYENINNDWKVIQSHQSQGN